MNAWDFFPKIYCLNLPHRTDRWEQCQKEFESVGLTGRVERYEGTYKPDNPVLGALIGHLGMIRQAKKEGVPCVLTFEDDVKFFPEYMKYLPACIEQLQQQDRWDLFYLGATVHQPSPLVAQNLIRCSAAFATHAIAFNESVYDFILENCPGGDVNDDVFFSRRIVSAGRSFCIYPTLCTQRESFSDVQKRVALDGADGNINLSYSNTVLNGFERLH